MQTNDFYCVCNLPAIPDPLIKIIIDSAGKSPQYDGTKRVSAEAHKELFDGVGLEIDGKQYRAIELADVCGLKVDTIVQRASLGLSYDEVISKQRRVYVNGLKAGAEASSIARKARTHCKRGHSFDEANSYINKNGDRFCRACRAMKAREKRKAI